MLRIGFRQSRHLPPCGRCFLLVRVKKNNELTFCQLIIFLAGVEGFEPPDDGVRVRSLTAWRYPNMSATNTLCNFKQNYIITFCLFFQVFYTHLLKFFYYFPKILSKTLDIRLNVCYYITKIHKEKKNHGKIPRQYN